MSCRPSEAVKPSARRNPPNRVCHFDRSERKRTERRNPPGYVSDTMLPHYSLSFVWRGGCARERADGEVDILISFPQCGDERRISRLRWRSYIEPRTAHIELPYGGNISTKFSPASRQDFLREKIINVARGIYFPAAAPICAYLRLSR